MTEKSTAKNSVVSSAPPLELVTPFSQKLLAAKSCPPRRWLRDETVVKVGADFRVRDTATDAAREQPFQNV
jgi:hypothetical protein